jgi:hypothetical protein
VPAQAAGLPFPLPEPELLDAVDRLAAARATLDPAYLVPLASYTTVA